MSPGPPRPPDGIEDEVAALLESLNRTGQRLEELTGGEIDSVADRSGRTFLLRGTQQQLQRNQASRQASILNALPAHIAMLDAAGTVVAVNEAWRRFGRANSMHDPGHGVGVNYLAICDAASGEHAGEARAVAAGIRAVLERSAPRYSIEYPCHAPAEERWFLLTVTPLAAGLQDGAVIMHLDISERVRGEEALRRFEWAMDATEDGIYLVDRESMGYLHINQTACRMLGLPREEIMALGPHGVLQRPREELEREFDGVIAHGADAAGAVVELLRTRDNGSKVWIELRRHAVRWGARWNIVSIARDITERRAARDRIRRLNRVHAVLSGISDLIVRVRDRDELYREACRIAAEAGGFRMSMIAVVEPLSMRVVPVAMAGKDDELQARIRSVLSTVETAKGTMVARAIREQRPVVANDSTKDPRVLFGAKYAESGVNSIAVLPLLFEGKANGVLALYSGEPGFFDEAEMELLGELASNVAFAMANLDRAEQLERMVRVNAMLSGVNGAIVRIRERQELFDEACRIAVETGGMAFAWIGMVDAADMRVRPTASVGVDEGYFQTISNRLSLRDGAADGHGVAATAIRECRTVVVPDVLADADIRHRSEFVDRGIRSIAAFPLFIDGSAIGVIVLNAGETGFFDEEEVHLLHEVVGNIAYALEHIGKEEKVRRLTRVYAVLSGINALIVRAGSRDELFAEACSIAVEAGEFRLAWVGLVEPGGGGIAIAASAGKDPDIAAAFNAHFAANKLAAPQASPGVITVRDKLAFVSNDSQNDPRIRFPALHTENAIRSMTTLPLIVGGEAVGVMGLYAGVVGFFDNEEMKLLAELAGDIAFALDHLDKRERLEYLAFYDALTGLANRRLLHERVGQYVRSAAAGGHGLALFMFDLERFKNINDSLGRAAGDTLLRLVADWLVRVAGDAGLVGRIGADHFGIVMPLLRNKAGAIRVLEKNLAGFMEHSFQLNDTILRVAVRIGVAVYPADGVDADALFRNAEAAMKKAKSSRERYLFYAPSMTSAVAGNLTMENQLRMALEKEEFVLHYQPKLNLGTGKVSGAEALIRWNDPRTGLVPPGRFIPILEETGLIYDVGRWALGKALEDFLRWRTAGLGALRIAVNVSPLQLRNAGFTAEIARNVGIAENAADGLEIEITESVIMADVKSSITILRAIRAMGVTVAIDDFGTGFSSLSYLSKLPVDTLKIDRSFVVEMTGAAEGLALVSTIINLGHSMNLKVVAEGVETEEQSRLLRLLKCDEIQGFLFSRPVPAEVFEANFLVADAALRAG